MNIYKKLICFAIRPPWRYYRTMEDMGLALAIFAGNAVAALLVLAWCNKKVKDTANPDNWKK